MAIGNNIKEMRSQRGIPAGTVANVLDMSVREYLDMENNGGGFTIDDIEQIAELLDCTPEELSAGEGIVPAAAEEDIRFVNSYVRTKEHIQGIAHYYTFMRPFSMAIMALFSVVFVISAIGLFVKFNPFFVVGLLYAPLHLVMQRSTYKRFVRMLVARDTEASGGEFASFEISVTDREIVCNNSAGNITHIAFNAVKKIVCNKKYMFITTTQGKIYTMEADAFTKGTYEEFISYIREKGIKVSGVK